MLVSKRVAKWPMRAAKREAQTSEQAQVIRAFKTEIVALYSVVPTLRQNCDCQRYCSLIFSSNKPSGKRTTSRHCESRQS